MCQESRFQILSLHTQKWQLWDKMLISLTVLVSSLCVSKHHVVHLDYGQFLFKKKKTHVLEVKAIKRFKLIELVDKTESVR